MFRTELTNSSKVTSGFNEISKNELILTDETKDSSQGIPGREAPIVLAENIFSHHIN